MKWLWSVWTLNQGGILADDMGLGCGVVECTDFQVHAAQHQARHPELRIIDIIRSTRVLLRACTWSSCLVNDL